MIDHKDEFWMRVQPDEILVVNRHVSETVPIKIGQMAAELGLRVTRSTSLPANISGLIRPATDTPSGFEILVNKYDTQERQRFTVAHEIGHYLLHRADIGSGIVDSVLYRSSLSSRKEVEANKVAANLVMPADKVAMELANLGGLDEPGIVEEMAALFKVSIPAMRIRLGVA
jgi:hypothetical protein